MSEKVFGWNEDGTNRCIISAPTKIAVARAYEKATGYRVTVKLLSKWGDWTGNEEEIRVASEKTGVPFRQSTEKYGEPWIEVRRE